MDGTRTRWSRRTKVLVTAAMVATVLGAWVLVPDDDPGALERARSVVEDRDSFETGADAAASLARAAQHLNDAIRECTAEAPGSLRCQALSSASGYTQVLATVVLTCTAPGRFEARTRAASYLARVAQITTEDAEVPEPPPLPEC